MPKPTQRPVKIPARQPAPAEPAVRNPHHYHTGAGTGLAALDREAKVDGPEAVASQQYGANTGQSGLDRKAGQRTSR